LNPARNPVLIRFGERWGVLYCEECGCCSGELGKSWVAFMCNDPDGIDEPRIAVYCPPCAAAEFGHRPDIAADYVCAWEPLPGQAPEASTEGP
jgi:hypothetical protein